MTGLILASILLPFLGSLAVLVVPRSWVKLLSQIYCTGLGAVQLDCVDRISHNWAKFLGSPTWCTWAMFWSLG